MYMTRRLAARARLEWRSITLLGLLDFIAVCLQAASLGLVGHLVVGAAQGAAPGALALAGIGAVACMIASGFARVCLACAKERPGDDYRVGLRVRLAAACCMPAHSLPSASAVARSRPPWARRWSGSPATSLTTCPSA